MQDTLIINNSKAMTEVGQATVRQEESEGVVSFIMTVPVVWRPKKPGGLTVEKTGQFVFRPVPAAKVPDILSRIMGIPNGFFTDEYNGIDTIAIREKHKKSLVYIAAAASDDRNEIPSKGLLKFVAMNFTFDMLIEAVKIATYQVRLDTQLSRLKKANEIPELAPLSARISVQDAIKEARLIIDSKHGLPPRERVKADLIEFERKQREQRLLWEKEHAAD